MTHHIYISYRYETVDGGAVARKDYVPKKGTLEFKPNEKSKMIKLEIIDEHTWEKDETFFVQLAVDTTKKNVHLGKHDRTKVVVINDDGKLITGRKLNNFEIFIIFI